MTLLLATQDFPPVEAGMSRYYASLAAGFAPGGIVVSTTGAAGDSGDSPPGVDVHREPFPMKEAHRPLNGLRWGARLDALVRELRPEALLCGNIRPLGPACWQIHRRRRVPYALILHGNDLLAARRRWSGWRRPLWNAVTGRAAVWITNSRATAEIGVTRCGLDPARNAVLYPEVDPARFRPDPAARRARRAALGLPEDAFVILFVGRLVARKGLDRLIEAAARFPREPEMRIVVAGFGDASPYRALAERFGVTDRVAFPGAVADGDLPGLYAAADVLAMPSRSIDARGDVEGFGIVYLEAAAAGLPAIAGRSGGAPEAVVDGRTGLVVDGESAEAIAAAVTRLGSDPELRARMGREGRSRAERAFGPGSMARRCREILAGRV